MKKTFIFVLTCFIALLGGCYPGASYRLEYAKEDIESSTWISEYKDDGNTFFYSLLEGIISKGDNDFVYNDYIFAYNPDNTEEKAWVFHASSVMGASKIYKIMNEHDTIYFCGVFGSCVSITNAESFKIIVSDFRYE